MLPKHVGSVVPCACLRTSSSSELFSESLSDGMPCILCMFPSDRAARLVQLFEICCRQLARMHMQRNDCVASNDAATLKALLRLLSMKAMTVTISSSRKLKLVAICK